MSDKKTSLHFEENSRLTTTSGSISPSEAAMAGAAAAYSLGKGAKLLAAHSEGGGASSLACAFISGASSMGAECILAGDCCAPAAAYAARLLGCGAGCHIHTEITASLGFFSGDGLTLYRSLEDKIESELGAVRSIPYSHFGKIIFYDGAEELYAAYVSGLLKNTLENAYADVYSSSSSIMRVCDRALSGKSGRSGQRIAFRISSDGRRVSAYSEETGYIFGDKLIMLCCDRLFRQGSDAAVCGRSPRALEKLAGRYGRKVLSCGGSVCINEKSPTEKCLAARKAAAQQPFMYDGIALMMTVLDILSEESITIGEAVSALPDYADINRYIPVDRPSELLRRLCVPGMEKSGVIGDSENGRVTIRPVRTGKGIMLTVESAAAETAAELCDFYSDMIKRAY